MKTYEIRYLRAGGTQFQRINVRAESFDKALDEASTRIGPEFRVAMDDWSAPEHNKVARAMARDYPRDNYGNRIPGKTRNLKIDNRPSVMVPERKTYTFFPDMLDNVI